MKLRDILTKETWEKYGDLDICNDVTEDMGHAWCGTLLTDEGRKHFKEALDVEAGIEWYAGYEEYVIELKLDQYGDSWSRKGRKAYRLFADMCGYCTEEEYDTWFDDGVDRSVRDRKPEPYIEEEPDTYYEVLRIQADSVETIDTAWDFDRAKVSADEWKKNYPDWNIQILEYKCAGKACYVA